MKTTLFSLSILLSSISFAQTHNNGALSTGATSKSGFAAPAGYTWSELQNNAGNTTQSNGSLGLGGTYSSASASFFLADDFTIPTGQTWKITSIDFFAYQTNYTGSTSPFNTARVNIFNSDPSVAGAVSVFGDDTTNRFSSSVDANMYRIGNSIVPSTTSTSTNRKIWNVKANTPVTLGAGTYWLKYQLQNVVIASGGYLPPVTIVDSRGLPTFNAKQFDAIGGVWSSITDLGNPATALDVPVDMPFVITFTTGDLGTNDVVQYDNRIQVYPNPVSNYFKISNPNKVNISSVEVLDTSGRVVKELKSAEEYDVSDLSKGSYFLKIKSNETTKVTKLIKQ